MESKFKESVDFVSHFYRRDAFVARRRFVSHYLLWRWRGVAAALAGCVLAASAAIVYVGTHRIETAQPEVLPVVEMPVEPVKTEVKRIEFVNAPLDSVVTRIENVYGVKVDGVSESDTMRLTLSYEGTAEDLVYAINLTLDTHLSISR